jgi:uncharacterized protein YcbK (DUF882 family)
MRMTTEVEDWEEINFFSKEEFLCKCQNCDSKRGVSFVLVQILDLMRAYLDFPMKVTSGYRCPMHPLSKNSTSSHARGLAVDIYCKNSANRHEMLEYVLRRGLFHRIGVASDFLHFDIDNDKVQRVIWTY